MRMSRYFPDRPPCRPLAARPADGTRADWLVQVGRRTSLRASPQAAELDSWSGLPSRLERWRNANKRVAFKLVPNDRERRRVLRGKDNATGYRQSKASHEGQDKIE